MNQKSWDVMKVMTHDYQLRSLLRGFKMDSPLWWGVKCNNLTILGWWWWATGFYWSIDIINSGNISPHLFCFAQLREALEYMIFWVELRLGGYAFYTCSCSNSFLFLYRTLSCRICSRWDRLLCRPLVLNMERFGAVLL